MPFRPRPAASPGRPHCVSSDGRLRDGDGAGVALGRGLGLADRRVPDGSVFLRAAVASPLGMLAIEAGWTVTEVGRQPWIVQGVMRTAEAVTPVPGLWISMLTYSALYIMLGIVVALLLGRQFRASPGLANSSPHQPRRRLTDVLADRLHESGRGRRRRDADLAGRVRSSGRRRLGPQIQ